jgi:hypothetical protein
MGIGRGIHIMFNQIGEGIAEQRRREKAEADRDMKLQASMATRGFERMNERENAKMQADMAKTPERMGGIIESLQSGNVIRLGNQYFKYNKTLAKNMSGAGMTSESAEDIVESLKKANPNLAGGWIPSTQRVGSQTFRYMPTVSEQYGMQSQQAPQQAMNDFIQSSQQSTTAPMVGYATGEDENLALMRKAIMRAMEKGASREEILKGIEEEGFKRTDFEDLLKTYNPNLTPFRNATAGHIAKGLGVPREMTQNFTSYLSSEIDKKRRVR